MLNPPKSSIVSMDVLARFQPWSGTVPAGYFAYFLGNIARAGYWAFSPELRERYDRERCEAFSAPAIDDNIFDWLVLLEAVADASEEFTMAALGAGWGRWLVAAAFAVRQRSGLSIRLTGVEAEPTHFRWMVEHFRDNGLDPSDHDLIEAAAGGRPGVAWFSCGRPDAWYGQSIIHDNALPPVSDTELEFRGDKVRMVRTVDLAEITARYRRLDYLHMDVQGAELEVLSARPDVLSAKVKRVLIGTHSHDIEIELRALFNRLGWECQYDIPLNGQIVVGGVPLTLGDGVQVWINRTL